MLAQSFYGTSIARAQRRAHFGPKGWHHAVACLYFTWKDPADVRAAVVRGDHDEPPPELAAGTTA